MQDVMTRLIDVPMARMFVLAGIVFLLVAVLGRIEGKIEPGNIGRVGASVVGILLIASGLAMYFIEGDALRDRLRESAIAAAAAPTRAAPAAKSAAAPSAAPAPGAPPAAAIKVVAGSYGRNCGAKNGNATAALAGACDGRASCDYRFDPASLEDPAPKCEKDYAAEWKCGEGANLYAVTLPAASVRAEALRLACAGG